MEIGMKRNLPAVLLSIALASICGCASVFIRTHPSPPRADGPVRYVYPGVAEDLDGLVTRKKDVPRGCMIPVSLIDLPLSFAVDTICLPYDLYKVTGGGLTRRGMREPKDQDRQQPLSPAGDKGIDVRPGRYFLPGSQGR